MHFVNARMRVRHQRIGQCVQQMHATDQRQLLKQRRAATVRLMVLSGAQLPVGIAANELH
jgi:hypothetical protein